MSKFISPVDLNILGHGFVAVAQEMAAALVRSAFSSIVREAKDCSTCLLDSQGKLVAQSHRIPIHMNSLSAAFSWIADHHDVEGIQPGEAFITNDPYRLGQHANDIILFTPVFFEDEVAGFAGSLVHHLDIGGGAAAVNLASVDVFGEGLLIPSLKISLETDLNGGILEQILFANVRSPQDMAGDLAAQVAANNVGERRLRDMVRRYGLEVIHRAMEDIQHYSERILRRAILDLPDGDYHATTFLDDDGVSDEPVQICVLLSTEGNNITVDLTGTAEQTVGAINAPFASTMSSIYSFVATHFLQDPTFINEGCYRPVTIVAPEGSLLNPRHPAPIYGRVIAVNRLYSGLKEALAKVAPDKVLAAGFDSPCQYSMSHMSTEGYRVMSGTLWGGWGAGPEADGPDALCSHLSNSSNLPVEYEEQEFDFLRLEGYELVPDSGGSGQFRGGLGMRRSYRILRSDVLFSAVADRFRLAAPGLHGGQPGGTGRFLIFREDKEITLGPKSTNVRLHGGDVLVLEMGGGGGRGDPKEREHDRVVSDLVERKVSFESALSDYGLTAEQVRLIQDTFYDELGVADGL